jgi:hypothetical protein
VSAAAHPRRKGWARISVADSGPGIMAGEEEKVFQPDDPSSFNLASMIVAQVALNYGLFCRKLIFHGAFDRNDRRLLKEMAANTAREIYVLKFLQPNQFLVEGAAVLTPEKRKSYLNAALEFPEPEPSRIGAMSIARIRSKASNRLPLATSIPSWCCSRKKGRLMLPRG